MEAHPTTARSAGPLLLTRPRSALNGADAVASNYTSCMCIQACDEGSWLRASAVRQPRPAV
eukprot:355754-Chlamydomonas_euryale.AAC.24